MRDHVIKYDVSLCFRKLTKSVFTTQHLFWNIAWRLSRSSEKYTHLKPRSTTTVKYTYILFMKDPSSFIHGLFRGLLYIWRTIFTFYQHKILPGNVNTQKYVSHFSCFYVIEEYLAYVIVALAKLSKKCRLGKISFQNTFQVLQIIL